VEAQLGEILAEFKGRNEEVIPILQRTQEAFGYLPEEAMGRIARFTGVTESRLYGVASFYAQFRLTPVGENRIMVCRGTACHVRGAQQVLSELSRQLGIEEGQTTADGKYTLETVACVGCCALAPCVTVNNRVHGRLNLKKTSEILAG
jgi:NADH-quinone oxidoreductase subunit E